MRLTFVSAELSPLVKAGGLGDAVAGLRKALLSKGHEVTTIIPDYFGWDLADETIVELAVPDWAGPASARTGFLEDGTPLTVVHVPGIDRPHPYDDPTGTAWPDNPHRFFAFAAAAAAAIVADPPDVLHVHDWHAGGVFGFLADAPPSVLSIHNLAYQGRTGGEWLAKIPHHAEAYEWFGDTNPLSGAIALADRVVTVSPTFASEIVQEGGGFGLEDPLRHRWEALSGIINGLDTEVWNPQTDPLLPARYTDLAGKTALREALLERLGWPDDRPVVSMVTRITDQKGVDFALDLVPYLDSVGVRFALLGSGDATLAEKARLLAAEQPNSFAFLEGYDEPLAHLLFAGADLYLMPSRFEPCGLTQMQAMTYGTIPIATAVGGLVDTIIDADADRRRGTGFLSLDVGVTGLVDALHRAVRAWRSPQRRTAIQRRGMAIDWSWTHPAKEYEALYESVRSTKYGVRSG